MEANQSIDQLSEPQLTAPEPEVVHPFMAYVGINEAARLVGKGKTQIYNDIKAGKLSWCIENERKMLRVSDLDRVYKLKANTSQKLDRQNHNAPLEDTRLTTDKEIELAVLRAELRAKEEALRRADDEIADLRQKQDRQLETIQRLTLLLPAPGATIATKEPERGAEPILRQSFWKRLFS